jgi:polyhydroxybutyrate depolymerase
MEGADLRPRNPYEQPGQTPGQAPARCSGLTRPEADHRLTIRTADGRSRVAEVHVPRTYDPRIPVPLVLNLHGFLSNPWEQELLSGMKARSEARNFILVFPQGSGEGLDPLSWNGPVCCPPSTDKGVDDVAFFRLLLDRLGETLCIDPRRIYATGMSNGGFMTHRLGCELSDRIAAIAPVAGQATAVPCAPRRPVPVMHFHGTKDQLVPYNGGKPLNFVNLTFPRVNDTIAGWVARNGCSGKARTLLTRPDSRCEIYEDGCRDGASVTLCTVEGGGHSWPGGSQALGWILGYTSPHLIATDLMIDFFFAHPMP